MKSHFGRIGRSRSFMLKERLLMISGGFFIASMLIAALLTFSSKETQARQDQTIKSDSTPDESLALGTVVLVAPVEDIPAGKKLSGISLREVFWPRDKVPEGAVRNVEDIREMFTKVALAAHQPITRNSLSASPMSTGIDNLLPEGHRAVTIEVDATAGVEGWATPSTHVDLFLTYLDSQDGQNKTTVAVEDAVVLSYNGGTEKNVSSEAGRQVSKTISSTATVTLAVPFDDALKIQTARAMGRLTLALRNVNDVKSRGGVEVDTTAFRTGRQNQKEQKSSSLAPQGFAKYSDGQGGTQQLMLGEDGRWYSSGNSDR